MIKNETDRFMATALEPRESGLPLYIVFNCYGIDRRFLFPRKHRKMIVEIAVDSGSDRRCGRFYWNEMIPVEVCESPKILLRGKKLKNAISLFSLQELETVYGYITRNYNAIKRHWIGESDSLELINELKR
jgi:hypothetical protein